VIAARFDDLVPGSERSFRLVDPIGELRAGALGQVRDVLSRAEREAAAGRWVAGFVAYEAAPALDPALAVREPDASSPFAALPLAWFGVFAGREAVASPAAVQDGVATGDADGGDGTRAPTWSASVPREAYVAAVERIRELIAAGRTYQVNHTLRMRTTLGSDLDRAYADLVLAQRGGFGADLHAGRFRILSASPELFFRWDGDRIVTRPMKGTAARGRWPAEDRAAAGRLRDSAKDRAENAMIVDLVRNDLGRVAVPGSVVAEPLFELERYETVWQMTSTIAAEVPGRTSLLDLFRALFPSGSVTGAPKVASMAAIARLEDSPRGVYTGAIGLLAPPGAGEPRAAFSVAIRTIVADTETRSAEFGVGAGITFGSNGDAEFDEVQAKSRVLAERRPAFDLFETLAWLPDDGYRHLEQHISRIGDSAAYFGFAFDEEAARTELGKIAADAAGPARVRLTLARDGAIVASTRPLAANVGGRARVAIVAESPVDPDDVFLFHKTTRRASYERRRALRPDADDVLLVNTAGRVTESTIANLAVRLDGSWWTPPLSDGLLPGIYRRILVADGTLRERSVSVEDVRAAEALELVSSVRGRRPVTLID
jgi:para-aminobenzoate synthetase / 4-amino-4-deoxychorismate lyase